jgi:hypothetical protein
MRILSSLVLISMLLGFLAAPAAAEGEKIGSISLFNPVQIFDETASIKGVRWNIIYGRHANVTGLDFGFVAGHATGNFLGVQLNAVNLVDGGFTGWQGGLLFSQVKGDFLGLQTSPINIGKSHSEGVMFGFVNMTNDMSGLQIAFVNVTENMHGLQIGILNIIRGKDKLPILPIVNWVF